MWRGVPVMSAPEQVRVSEPKVNGAQSPSARRRLKNTVGPQARRSEGHARTRDVATHRAAVGQVPAVGQRHAQDGVARLQQRQVHGLVGLRARMRLDVCIIRSEQLLHALDRQRLGHVHVLAAAVVALARITFRVLVGEHAALRLEHARAGVVLGGDQLDMVLLPAALVLDGLGQDLVVTGNARVAGEHGGFLGRAGDPKV